MRLNEACIYIVIAHAHTHTYTDARTDTHSLSHSHVRNASRICTFCLKHTRKLCMLVRADGGWRLAAGGWQMLSAGSGRRLPVKHLLDTLVTLLKRACVRDFAVVMKLSTASRTRVMDWTSVCVYDWMCLRVQRGRAGLRVTAEIRACIHGCAHVYVVCTRMYTRTRARAHTQSTTCHVTGKTLLTPAQEYLLHCGDPRCYDSCCTAAYDTAIHVLLVQARDLGPMT